MSACVASARAWLGLTALGPTMRRATRESSATWPPMKEPMLKLKLVGVTPNCCWIKPAKLTGMKSPAVTEAFTTSVLAWAARPCGTPPVATGGSSPGDGLTLTNGGAGVLIRLGLYTTDGGNW